MRRRRRIESAQRKSWRRRCCHLSANSWRQPVASSGGGAAVAVTRNIGVTINKQHISISKKHRKYQSSSAA